MAKVMPNVQAADALRHPCRSEQALKTAIIAYQFLQ
jgi:hypothetical protein